MALLFEKVGVRVGAVEAVVVVKAVVVMDVLVLASDVLVEVVQIRPDEPSNIRY